MKRVVSGLVVILLFAVVGCTGRTANVTLSSIPSPHYDFTVPSSVSFRIGQGNQNYFVGAPSGFSGSALKARIDTKQIQEAVAQKVLNKLYSKVEEYPQHCNITSILNDFSYRWPFEFKLKPRMMVSFVITISAKDEDANLLYSDTITVKDSLGPYGEISVYGAAFWPLMQKDADHLSQRVGDTLLEKIYEIYTVEFEKIARKHMKIISSK